MEESADDTKKEKKEETEEKTDDSKAEKKEESVTESKKKEEEEGTAQNVFLEEDREVGNISFKTLLRSFKVFGGLTGLLFLTCLTGLANLGDYGAQWLILKWTDAYIAKSSDEHYFLYLIFGCLMARNVLNGFRGLYAFTTVARASRRIHSRMLFKVIHAKLGEFLHRIPSGQ